MQQDRHRRAARSQQDLVWRTLCARQLPALERGLCRAFIDGARALDLDPTRFPRHAALSRRLHARCGWRIETVPGLIPARDFFALLRERRFPSPEWLRHPDDLEYTPEPDAFHDLFGHLPQLAAPALERVLERLAFAAHDADDAELERIERVYWFTIEFGLIEEARALRAIGAGLASSIAELERALHEPAVQRRSLALADAAATDFVTDRPQELYLVTRDLAKLASAIQDSSWRRLGRVA